jgi:hypothetical protein
MCFILSTYKTKYLYTMGPVGCETNLTLIDDPF